MKGDPLKTSAEPEQKRDTFVPNVWLKEHWIFQDKMGLGKWYGVSKEGRKISGFYPKKWLGEPIRYERFEGIEFPIYAEP